MTYPKPKHVVSVLLIAVVIAILSGTAAELTSTAIHAAPLPTPDKVFSAYKGVGIGMKMDEARKLLGDPRDKSDAQDFYVFSENETAQVFYEAQMVTAVSVDFSGDLKSAPSCKQVLGEEVAPKPDGGIYKLVRYPKAGYWVSYSKTGGSNPIVSVTIQKM